MTPKEKAKEIFNKYEKKLMYDYNNYHYKYNLEHCKQCALIAVDEMINFFINLSNEGFTFYSSIEYWQEVKQEIEKL
jgi:hypothetical protein